MHSKLAYDLVIWAVKALCAAILTARTAHADDAKQLGVILTNPPEYQHKFKN